MSIFQIVQMDPDAAKWIGFAKQQCKRIMDNGTKDFYREWPLGDATVKAKSYGGTVKLWLISNAGDLVISTTFRAAIPPDGNYYVATDNIKYDATIPALTLKKKGYSSITTNSSMAGWPGLPNQRKTSWLVLGTPTFSVDSVTGHKLFSVTYISLKATGKTNTAVYNIESLLPGATTAYLFNAAPLGNDTLAVYQLYDPVLGTTKIIACSRNDGTFCEVTGVSSYSFVATQNVVWMVDGTVFQRVTKSDGVLTNTGIDIPSSTIGPVLPSIGLISIGGCSLTVTTTGTNISLWQIDEDMTVTTKSYSSADIAALTGVSGTYAPQPLSVACTDADVVSCSYWGLNTTPFPIIGVRITLAGLTALTPLQNEGQMIDGGNLGDGLYGVCYYSGTLASYAYTIKAFDAAGTLQDTTEIVNTNATPSTVSVVGTSAKAVYVWAPFVYATPDVDFIFQRATSPTRTVITSAADPTFTVTLTGLWDNPARVYYNAKTRTLVIANQIAVINVGRKDMAFVQPTAFVFKPPTIADASASFISAYQRPASNAQAAVFSYPQAESWGQLWDTQMAAMQPSLPP